VTALGGRVATDDQTRQIAELAGSASRPRYTHARMRRREFRRHAEAFWAQIPGRYRAGATLLVHDDAEPDPEHEGVFLLGACEPAFGQLEDALEAVGGGLAPLERASLVHLWYGSFAEMDARSPAFAWADEIEETLLHELTHHWEQRAGLDALDRFDAAQIENFRRHQGRPFEHGFWRDGVPSGPARWTIDGDVFVEVAGPPPWEVDPLDGEGALCVAPAEGEHLAVVEERGAPIDGARGQLVVVEAPPRRSPLLDRVLGSLAALTRGVLGRP
jgi:hypothetical protein